MLCAPGSNVLHGFEEQHRVTCASMMLLSITLNMWALTATSSCSGECNGGSNAWYQWKMPAGSGHCDAGWLAACTWGCDEHVCRGQGWVAPGGSLQVTQSRRALSEASSLGVHFEGPVQDQLPGSSAGLLGLKAGLEKEVQGVFLAVKPHGMS